jgi:hypothetical protein
VQVRLWFGAQVWCFPRFRRVIGRSCDHVCAGWAAAGSAAGFGSGFRLNMIKFQARHWGRCDLVCGGWAAAGAGKFPTYSPQEQGPG